MSISKIKGQNVDVHLWAPLNEVESGALDQLRTVAALPWVVHRVCAMADVHQGMGATVGSVIAMKGAVAPSAVGVDLGCGMGAIRTNLTADNLPDDLSPLRSQIESAIPVGFNSHDEPVVFKNTKLGTRHKNLFEQFSLLNPKVQELEGKALRQVGTLGGGNHFIELCLSDETCVECEGEGSYYDASHGSSRRCSACKAGGLVRRVWMMLHSGSRNIGKELAEKHMKAAMLLEHNRRLPLAELSVFLQGTPEFSAYVRDLLWAQEYAFLNRLTMFELYKSVMVKEFPGVRFDEPILCHHNYVAFESHLGDDLVITRKGAISAKAGELGIIPGSMGTSSYIVEGLGNEESFGSASHGAGRRMSRGAAKRTFSLGDLAEQTHGIECRKDEGVLNEIPGAYKDIDQVMENQKDLVKIRQKLSQVLCVKG